MSSLTQAEARARARVLTVDTYLVELDLTRGVERFGSRTTVRFRCAEPGAGTFAEIAAEPTAAVLNGAPLPTAVTGNRLRLPALAADNELVVTADLPYSNSGEGMHLLVDPSDGETYLCATSALDSASRTFACFDQPDLKARITLRVTAPAYWTVLANAEGRRVDDGTADVAVWEFDECGPMSTYLFTVCAGPYHSVFREHAGRRLGWHCRASLAEHLDRQADELFELTGQCLDWYERTFGMRYPFGDKYDQVFVPEFLHGAMENIGCVTFRDELLYRSAVTDAERELRAMIIAHEMAHMWFGDLVTLRWWDDLWLNESFAEYLGFRVASEATRFRHAWASFGVTRKLVGYEKDQGPSTHPVAPADVPDVAHGALNVDAISYPKGASALRQLATLLGDDTFWAGLRRYFQRFAYANADLSDLIGTMAEVSGRDLRDWSARWLRTTGVDLLTPDVTVADGAYTGFAVRQDAPQRRPHRIRIGCYDAEGGRRTADVDLDADRIVAGSSTSSTGVPELVGTPAAELVVLNDEDLTFARTRFAPGDTDRLGRLLPRLADPVTRTVVWTNLWDMVRSGDAPPESFVDLAAAVLPAEDVPAVQSTVLRLCQRVADAYVASPADTLARLADLGGRLLAAGDPAHRLVGARLVASSAATDAQVARLHGWLRGAGVPEGVAMDADLRWSVLFRLVTVGAAGADEIAAELAADRTASGEVAATKARAALPDAAAKRVAWERLMTDRSLSNRHLEALGHGFWRPEHAALTGEYVPRFFTELPATAAFRSPAMLMLTARDAYPVSAVTERTVELAAALLADDDLHPVLRRYVTDQDHEVRVALAVRRRPAGGAA
ncbi:aminopeptidase N [Actinocatenispora rupis]|uniref:Aminopeptidase N n=1 Tax=Actinocatenispora rupis TaxID=519421 RepID=A0A8J3NF50_9ACTN|nr:aminopeptidase N [Actinocatenispora rupis]GID14842.1 aminopeptidase [Actinocatenispora rupis]